MIKRILKMLLVLFMLAGPTLVSANASTSSRRSSDSSSSTSVNASSSLSTSASSNISTNEKPSDDDRPDKLIDDGTGMLALNYHRVRNMDSGEKLLKYLSNSKELTLYSVAKDDFEAQMAWLVENNAHFLTLDEVLYYVELGDFPDKAVWINFDDMDRTIYENAHPILEKYQIPATGFVITGQVGNSNFNSVDLITQAELEELRATGLWEFGTHTHDLHYLEDGKSALVEADVATVEADLRASQQYLTEHFGENLNGIAYPYGMAEDGVNQAMDRVGIDYGFTLEDKAISVGENHLYLPRIMITDDAFNDLVKEWEGFK